MKRTTSGSTFPGSGHRHRPRTAVLLYPLLLAGMQVAAAQGLRDPTLAPSPSFPGAVSASDARAAKTLALVSGPLTLVQRNGQRYVVLEAHLYAEGQNFGRIRIERIRETEVWFRDGAALYKMSRFPGIERHAATPDATSR